MSLGKSVGAAHPDPYTRRVPPLVTASDLRKRLGDPDLVVADVRWYLDGRSARAAFEAGHLPRAVFVDLDRDLAGPVAADGAGGRHPLPSPERFAEAMTELGIHDHSTVVAYDDTGGATAGRLWWMLDALGVDAAVLTGGIDAWDGPLETGPGSTPAPSSSSGPAPPAFTTRPWPADRFVDAETVAEAIACDLAVVVDARAPGRFRGETEPIDPVAGHIPGARNLPSSDLASISADELRAVTGGDRTEVIASCGSGVTACHALLVIADHRGTTEGLRLYTGSWSDWVSDDRRPVVTGEG